MSAEIADVLDKAAEVIETRGLANGAFWDGGSLATKCRVCTWGAISLVTNGTVVPPSRRDHRVDGSIPVLFALAGHLGLPPASAHDAFGVPEWSDAHDPSEASQVVAALRNAAAAERAS